jgi:hypothetical protein
MLLSEFTDGNYFDRYTENACLTCRYNMNIRCRDVPNGSYSILDQGGTKATKMYCQMTSLEGCEGGGWTMAMKIDGGQVGECENSGGFSLKNPKII